MKPRRAAVVGGGVIGGGWVARLIQNGVDVGIFDPDPEAPRKIGDVMANADHAVARLTMAPLPERGEMRFRRQHRRGGGRRRADHRGGAGAA